MTTTLKIDLFTDTVCPWCLVGAARLDRALADLPPDVVVDVERHPFYLDPDVPDEGYEVAEMLRAKYGREPAEIWERCELEAQKSGIALELAKQPRVMPTRKGHTLVRLARDKGTQHALANALAAAYFLDHRPVADDAVLADIAVEHGFSREEALQAMADPAQLAVTHELAVEAMRQGIQGVPFFVFENRFAIAGAQPQEVFERALRVALGTEGLTA